MSETEQCAEMLPSLIAIQENLAKVVSYYHHLPTLLSAEHQAIRHGDIEEIEKICAQKKEQTEVLEIPVKRFIEHCHIILCQLQLPDGTRLHDLVRHLSTVVGDTDPSTPTISTWKRNLDQILELHNILRGTLQKIQLLIEQNKYLAENVLEERRKTLMVLTSLASTQAVVYDQNGQQQTGGTTNLLQVRV